MKLSYNKTWSDAAALLRHNGALLLAIAGVFIFLPTLALGYFFPPPEAPPGASLEETLGVFVMHLRHTAIWYVLQSFVVMIGTGAMLRLVLGPRTTVAGAIGFGVLLLPAYSILALLTNVVGFAGAIFLIVPGLYLWARLAPAGPAMVAEGRRNPIDAFKRGWALSTGAGWAVLGLILLVVIPGSVLLLAIEQVSGILFILAAGQELGRLLTAILLCALSALLAVVVTMLYAAIYRALAARHPA